MPRYQMLKVLLSMETNVSHGRPLNSLVFRQSQQQVMPRQSNIQDMFDFFVDGTNRRTLNA